MQMVASRRAGPVALLDLRPITAPYYPNDFVAYRFDPTTLITTLDDATATAQSLLSTSAVALSGSAFRSGAGPGPWDQLAFAPLTCLLFAASPAASGLGMDWTLEASENLEAPPRNSRYQTTFEPGWVAAAAWAGDRLFEARVRAVLNMDAKQRDSVKMTVTKVLTAWLLTARRDRGLPMLELSFLDDGDATPYLLTPADGTVAVQAIVLMDLLINRQRTKVGQWEEFHHIGLFLDEITNTPIPRLPQYLAESRGLGCAICFAAQAGSQLDAIYGPLQGKAIRDVTPAALIMYGSHERDVMESAAFWSGKADPELTGDTQATLWRQFLTATLYHRTGRWPDLCAATEVCPPPTATYVPAEVLAATATLRAMALASLGQPWAALDLLAQVSTGNVYIAADAALTKGWCLRELGEDDAANDAFLSAAVDGQVIPQARTALQEPTYRIVTTDAETIATRTDKWDPGTETSRDARAADALATERQQVLARAQERIDELIGLQDAKEQIALWRTEIQIDELLAEQGEAVAASNENHMVFLGPPDTAKTTFARVVGDVLFGLGKIARPDVKEVTEEDIVVGYVSQTAARMKEVCEEARGRGAVHRRGLPAGAQDRGPLVRRGRHQHAAQIHGGLPRRAGGHRRRLSRRDARLPQSQPRAGRAVPLHADLRQLHPRGDRGDRAALGGQRAAAGRGRDVEVVGAGGLSAALGALSERHPARRGRQRPLRAQGDGRLPPRTRPPAAPAGSQPGRT